MQELEIATEDALWNWLDDNHNHSETVRLITWKVAHPAKYVGREAVLDALIAFGWIDGH